MKIKYDEFKGKFGDRDLTVTTNKYCGQSNGSCILQCGETVVMVNTTMSAKPREGMDFFPLSVDFEEKMYSVGKIPGGWKKREGRPSDKAILTSRLIDRPIRPLFPKGFFNDVTVVATALSVDPDIAPETLAMLGSSIALSISDIPFAGPTGSCVVGMIGDKYIINPTVAEKEQSKMHVYVSGTKDAIMMVEAGANIVSETEMLDAIMFGHEEIKRQVAFQEKLVNAIGKPKAKIAMHEVPMNIEKAIREFADKKLDNALNEFDREKRQDNESAVEDEVIEKFLPQFPDNEKEISEVLYKMKKEKVRAKILEQGIRPDGRKSNEIRPIWCEVGVLPRVHGSGVFTRGQTQVMTTLTLGMLADVQKLEGLDEEDAKRYMHHYNMPPYSTGEAKPLRSAGRREIGHGALAERSLEPVLPTEEEFPYAIRTVSEVLSSNGSTSQASVCGSTLALMDAGVPLKAPVAGIAMGLMKSEDQSKVVVLSDIQGLEDFFGDMDFKVAGTSEGITAIQMDIKIKGIDKQILTTALEQAKVGRLHILSKMLEVINAPRTSLSKYAPKIITFQIDPDQIREVIGTGGKVINKIIEQTGVKIDISDDGDVYIATSDETMAQKAKQIILAIISEVQPGMKFVGVVQKTTPFGAFIELAPGKDGMVHISKLSDQHVEKVEDVVKEGDKVEVEVLKVDQKGRIDLKLIKKF